jgi:hypothetical protein
MLSLIYSVVLISSAPAYAKEGLPEFPLPKDQVNSCLGAVYRVGYYLACGKDAATITSVTCRDMRRERFRSPPKMNKHGLVKADTSYDMPYSASEAARLIPADGSGAIYRKALWDTAKATDKGLLAVQMGAWALDIGATYLFSAGRAALGGAMYLGGWGVSAYSSKKLLADISENTQKHFMKAHSHVQACLGGDNQYALSEATIKSCLEQKLPHHGVMGVFSGLLASGREGELARDQLRAFSSEGYSWEMPAAQFTVACGLIQSLDEQYKAIEGTQLSCDKSSGQIELNGKKFVQTMEIAGTEIQSWSLESAEPFVEVKEGILGRKSNKKAYINMKGRPLPDSKDRADLGEAMNRQLSILAPRLLDLKDCGGKKPPRRPIGHPTDSPHSEDPSGQAPAR